MGESGRDASIDFTVADSRRCIPALAIDGYCVRQLESECWCCFNVWAAMPADYSLILTYMYPEQFDTTLSFYDAILLDKQ